MIHINLVDEFSPEQLILLPENYQESILSASLFIYEVIGEIPYGILGVVTQSMMAREAVVWFRPHAGICPSRQELRSAKALNLADEIGFTPLADIHVDNIAARKFAIFFGLKKQSTDGEYHRYAGEKLC